MIYPERFSDLPENPWPRLRALLGSYEPGAEPLAMALGEPRHAPPPFLGEVMAASIDGFGRYPPNDGTPELMQAIADWHGRRYGVQVDAETRILPLNGSREGLFNAAVALCAERKGGARSIVLVPNPFYQVYALGGLTAGAELHYVPVDEAGGYLPDYAGLPDEVLNRVVAAYVCSPTNPQGGVASRDYWRDLLALAEKHDFLVFADECYSEVWQGEAPAGALEMAEEVGADPERVVTFNSLSKRSNLPGLRSGFAVAGPKAMAHMKRLRAYAGAPLPLPVQAVSARAWADEAHVEASRQRYLEKYRIADEVFAGVDGVTSPAGGFFLWLPVEDSEAATLRLWREAGIRVLPGAYLSRQAEGGNPGAGRIRVALVADEQDTKRGLMAIRETLYR